MGENKKIAAVCLAAGQGKRMKSKVQKQYLLIKERPVLYYTLNAFADVKRKLAEGKYDSDEMPDMAIW